MAYPIVQPKRTGRGAGERVDIIADNDRGHTVIDSSPWSTSRYQRLN